MTKDELLTLIERTEAKLDKLHRERDNLRNDVYEVGYEIEDVELALSNLNDDLYECEDDL